MDDERWGLRVHVSASPARTLRRDRGEMKRGNVRYLEFLAVDACSQRTHCIW